MNEPAAAPAKHIKHFLDLKFTVVAEPHSHRVEYTIYEIDATDENDNPLWHKKDSAMSPNPVATLEEAEVFISGSVKWDGCSNWWLHGMNREVMYHGCEREDLTRVGDIMARCWDWTEELIESWDELADSGPESVDEAVQWLKTRAEHPKITDYLEGYAMGQVEGLTKAGAKKIAFKLILEETKRNNGQVAGYLLLLQTHVDGNREPVRTHAIYYLVNQEGKIVSYLIPPH